jgi:hypothetical protein
METGQLSAKKNQKKTAPLPQSGEKTGKKAKKGQRLSRGYR